MLTVIVSSNVGCLKRNIGDLMCNKISKQFAINWSIWLLVTAWVISYCNEINRSIVGYISKSEVIRR